MEQKPSQAILMLTKVKHLVKHGLSWYVNDPTGDDFAVFPLRMNANNGQRSFPAHVLCTFSPSDLTRT
jgi:hypothetical protein